MTLSPEDSKLFYSLWLPLLDYVNDRFGVNPKLSSMRTAKSLDPAEVRKVADKLWPDVTIIDDYLEERDDLPEEHRQIIRSWKRRVRGDFMMERHLKKGTIFISEQNAEVYQVSGIVSSWEEMFCGAPMPLLLNATFMPFRDIIISDGLVLVYHVLIGSGMKQMLRDAYMKAKENGLIHRSL